MSLLTKAGITRLSELIIDADKNWQAMGISNLKEVAASMVRGDLSVRGHAVLQRLAPGTPGHVLVSAGPGNLPAWMPAPAPLEVWIPAWMELGHGESIDAVDKSRGIDAPLSSSHFESYVDAPADNLKLMKPDLGLGRSATGGITPDKTDSKAALLTGQYGLVVLVGGAAADDGGVQTDETAEAKSDAPNDMTLLPAIPAVDDAYYFGHANEFDIMRLLIGQSGVGTWTITWEYWNGAWAALAGVTDGTNAFRAIEDWHDVSFTRPGDWALTTVLGMNLYWIRARVSAYTSISQQPLGTRARVEITG